MYIWGVAKIDLVSPFYPTLWLEKEILQWKNLQEVQKWSNELKFLLAWKPIPHFWIISVGRASLLPWKYLLVE